MRHTIHLQPPVAPTATHTPGPWRVVPRTGAALYNYGQHVSADHYSRPGIADGRDSVAEVRGGTDAERDANARLIAAAPDLLDALRDLTIEECSACDGSGKHNDDDEEACHRCGGFGEVVRGGDPNAIRAAIAKAEGR